MTVKDIVTARGITEVVHFTTNFGLTGILKQGECKARSSLREDQTLRYIRKLNTISEFDPAWKNYFNLSISRTNFRLFKWSVNMHAEASWRILSFVPDILDHPRVLFCETNNAYPTFNPQIKRGSGAEGLERLFSPQVFTRRGQILYRGGDEVPHFTTDVQAEVLYPQSLSIQYLQHIYVKSDDDCGRVNAKFSALGMEAVPILVHPDLFP